jgi:maltokinase
MNDENHGLDIEALAAFLGQQRWFAGKGREWQVSSVTSLGWLREEAPAVQILLAEVTYGDGETDCYQLPVVRYDAPPGQLAHALICEQDTGEGAATWIYDALHDKDVTGAWMRGIAEAASVGSLTFHRSPGNAQVPVNETSIVIGAEQSNTSLVFGGAAILKVFRRLSDGLNPDIEIHEALAQAGSTHIAPPLGWMEGTWSRDGASQTCTGSLAMAQVFLRDASEGWEMAKASVRDLFAEQDLHADEVGGDFAAESTRLGAATAEVHAMLAQQLGTRTATAEDLGALARAMTTRLERAATAVPQLASHADALRAAYADLAGLDGVVLQRIHGDYHLGQVMRTMKGWKLLDFEGEPAKTLEERRALDSPLKDVAGMLRSFDYAARHLLADRHESHLDYRATEWATRNRDAFCTGYGEVSGRNPCADSVLLRAFETDKAIYEVVYEARNRPTWVRIPLSAIERLAAAR